MTSITREQAKKIIEAADEVISALAGTNEDVHHLVAITCYVCGMT